MRTTYDYVEDAAKDILGLAAQMSDRIEELEAEQGTARDLISDLETQIGALEGELVDAELAAAEETATSKASATRGIRRGDDLRWSGEDDA